MRSNAALPRLSACARLKRNTPDTIICFKPVIHFYLFPLFAGIVNPLLGIYVWLTNPRRRLNQVFGLWTLGLGIWNLGAFFLFIVESHNEAVPWAKFTLGGVIIICTFGYHLAVLITREKRAGKKLIFFYASSFLFLILDLGPWIVADVRRLGEAWYSVTGTAFQIFSVTIFPLAGISTLWILRKAAKNRQTDASKNSRRFYFINLVMWLTGAHDLLLVLGHDVYPHTHTTIYPWGLFTSCFYGLLVSYGILSDQWINIRISLGRNAATTLRLTFFVAIAYILLLLSDIVIPSLFTNAALAVALATLLLSAAITSRFFPKLLGKKTAGLERRIMGDLFDYEDKVNAFIETIPLSNNTQELINRVAERLAAFMDLAFIGISISARDSRPSHQAFIQGESQGAWVWPEIEVTLLDEFKTSGKPSLVGQDQLLRVGGKTAGLLKEKNIAAAFAIAVQPRNPSGLLIIGPKRKGDALTSLDRELLQRLCRQVAFEVERLDIVHAEQLRQASRAKDQFLASINHEIRNPLNGIIGITRMLADTNSDPRHKFLLSTLQACSEQLHATMDDVLDFADIESSRINLRTSDIELVELVKTTCASYDLNGKNISFGELPARPLGVRCDAGKVRQILSNYVGNALKYGIPPQATVSLKEEAANTRETRVTISVASTGPTLTTEEQAGLFTTFFRGQRARETNAHGTGLGLALSKKLAEAMGGQVGVTSAEGETIFSFSAVFPLVAAALVERAFSDVHPRITGRALAIEDEPYNRLVMSHYLGKLGLSVVWAENGRSALNAVRTQSFDVILMDWFLPDIYGTELIGKMRTESIASLPPIVVISAYSTTEKRNECLAAGAAVFVSKPATLAKLEEVFEELALKSNPSAETISPAVDLDIWRVLEKSGVTIESFIGEIKANRALLMTAINQRSPHAASLAHRLKATTLLIQADSLADRLALLERILDQNAPTEEIAPLANEIESELIKFEEHILSQARKISQVTESI